MSDFLQRVTDAINDEKLVVRVNKSWRFPRIVANKGVAIITKAGPINTRVVFANNGTATHEFHFIGSSK